MFLDLLLDHDVAHEADVLRADPLGEQVRMGVTARREDRASPRPRRGELEAGLHGTDQREVGRVRRDEREPNLAGRGRDEAVVEEATREPAAAPSAGLHQTDQDQGRA
ncbi:MAG TPA: hypothetical protein VLH75_08300 [Longimicrobiales bacterium]|nr:hypothetical protein [Longimicrobiales bacterium]